MFLLLVSQVLSPSRPLPQIVQSVHRSLAALSKVIRGTLLLTSEVQLLADHLLRQEVRGETHTKKCDTFIVFN